ncbi:MAG: hypothetical protein JW765_05475 [Deltaproteobacteria bacterium]|nr:hypothetical protein [Candidatus Zymogenaceae bacterium]
MVRPATARRLSAGETFYWLVDRVCSTNFTVAARLSGPLEPDVLRAALAAVGNRHPLLGVRIARKGGWPVFRTDGVGPIPLFVADTPEDEWIARAADEINRNLDWRAGPLARCVWLRHSGGQSTLMITFHHAVGDGISGGYLIRDLLRAIAAPGKNLLSPRTSNLPEALDRLHPPEVQGVRGLFRYAVEMARAGAAVVRYGRLRAVSADGRAPYRDRRARVIARVFDPSFTADLVARARVEGTTVHGALAAAVLLGGRGEISAHGHLLMALGSPVNMRGRVTPPVGDVVGMYASVMGTMHRVGKDTAFWELAREVTGGIEAGFARNMHFTFEPMTFRILSPFSRLAVGSQAGAMGFTRLAAASFPSTGFGLTNIGRLDMRRRYGAVSVSWAALLPSWSVFAHSGWSACTAAGSLSLNLVYMEPLLARAHAEALAGRTVELLRAAV